MKQTLRVLLLFILVLSQLNEGLSQDFNFDHLNSENGTLLTGWKYKAGDRAEWADPRFDDSDWEKIDGGADITDFINEHPQHLGWFRLKFRVEDSLRNKSYAIFFNAFAATEVYLNGKLVKINGKINSDPRKVKAINGDFRPFSIYINNDSIQTLAVRYAYPKGIPYIREFWQSTTLVARIVSPNQSIDTFLELDKKHTKNLIFLLTGIFLILSVLHGLFFAFYRYQKQHIYYASFTLSVAVLYAGAILLYDTYEIRSRMWLTILYHIVWIFHSVFFTLAIYSIFQYSKRHVLRMLLLVSILAIPLVFFKQNNLINVFVSFIPLLYNIEAFRITMLSGENKVRGSGIIKTGLLIFMLLWLISMGFIATQDEQNIVIGTMLNSIGSTAIVIMMSVIISLQVAGINRKLIEKLTEVEELSKEKEKILEDQKNYLEKQVQERTFELQKTLKNLKSTQGHLIQSVKLASLGELTAGIAHEIQNPLNFVNNFSEINVELIEEMKEEMDNGNFDEAKLIANDIKENEQKINHHGKRADSIVKGMLQHSRTSNGKKESTDINALIDEYSRLAYHGLRAKDNLFNATLITDFDETIGRIDLIPQDIGRVMLNLINNAFYAVDEKKKTNSQTPKGVTGYTAEVAICTKLLKTPLDLVPISGREGLGILISISDNGNGISQKVLDKIFQPFFTTKPTGQGTGLGLSLAYDIIKAHGGELKVDTKEGEGSEFVIYLPAL